VRNLELVVPPDVVALVIVGVMWGVSRLGAAIPLAPVLRNLLGAVLVLVGLAVIIAARKAFAQRDTPWGPQTPSRASALVTDGVYGLSRNPMYLGTWVFLLGIGVMMGSYFSAASSLLYSVYIDRFQIVPEERALALKFGQEFDSYRTAVRRWF
jgi:protein-S-isoprenylcysteine O-methyltransferase Ste14